MTAAALVAGVLASSAQVYSANVVGYVTKKFQTGMFTLVNNPLNAATNDLQTIIVNPPDGTAVYRWSVAAQDFDPAVPTYFTSTGKWIPNATIKPGEGFFVAGGGDFTNTFVGDVLQGTLTNSVAGNGNFVAFASQVPVGGSLTNVLASYPATDGDNVYVWSTAAQDFDPSVSTYYTATGKWSPDQNIAVGDGFFLVRAGGDVTWTRTFTVQ